MPKTVDPVFSSSVLAAADLATALDIDALTQSLAGLEGKVDKNPKTAAIILAGGTGERFGKEGGKQLVEIGGLLLLLLAAVIVRYTMIRRRWETRFSRTAPAQSVAWVAKALSLLWPVMKLGYDGGSIFAFSEALRETDAAYADAVRTIAALNAEARFSSHAMTREQAAQARMIWQQSVARLKRERRPLRRFWLKWVRCMY